MTSKELESKWISTGKWEMWETYYSETKDPSLVATINRVRLDSPWPFVWEVALNKEEGWTHNKPLFKRDVFPTLQAALERVTLDYLKGNLEKKNTS